MDSTITCPCGDIVQIHEYVRSAGGLVCVRVRVRMCIRVWLVAEHVPGTRKGHEGPQ